ncbi:MAG: hypothetical protein VKI83_05855 [Synechococcaceae cyanobacterium]|nr:hypothetical protein [Synechococcaceae cyanobacterium]
MALSLAAPGAQALTLSPRPAAAPAGDHRQADGWGRGGHGGGGGWSRPDSWGRGSRGGGKNWNSDRSWWGRDRNRWHNNRWNRNERWDHWRWPINNVTYRRPGWVRPGWQGYRPWRHNAGWYGPNYWNNWGWWNSNAALWGLGTLATTAVISSAVNSAINTNQPTIVVPNTSYQLYYGSVNAESNNVVSFMVTRDGRNYQMAADCADGELNGHAPVTPAEAELLNSACQVAFSN